jgi:hypothetical protein
MLVWEKRAVEEANLFNPAFCGALIVKTVEDFAKKASRGLAFPLSFLVLPIVLHHGTRQALPGSTVTSLLPWLQENRQQLVDFPDRVRRLKSITQESIMFSMGQDVLVIAQDGSLSVGTKKISITDKSTESFTSEARECVDRARFLGRWLATAGTTATIMAGWGVAP